ncbi:MAG: nucleoside triphosphate pyrophosphohydrolase [Anaerolineae bacterium]|nr:nucleoside triphosphate pyrophosphohydrolase [Anaerolineae bacterium]
MTITIVGLGPGSVDDLSLKAWRTLENAEKVYLRTERHPCVPQLPQNTTYKSFDALYESIEAFEDVYAKITETLLKAAKSGAVVYAVPGDPLVGESTTTRILAAAKIENITVNIINGISFIEPMLAHLGIDALNGLQILDGLDIAAMHHPPINPEYPTLIAQVYSRTVASDIKLTLMNQYPDDFEVTLIHGAGTEGQIVETIPLYEIDRSEQINHLTSLYLPAAGEYTSFESFQEVIAHLRAPEGCPWDRKQTHESLRPYLIEEAYEVLEAIDNGDWEALVGELGDLLLQIVLHTQIATEYDEFHMKDVLEYVNRKMIRRHPHVWGTVDVNGNPDTVVANWEEIKQREKSDNGEKTESLLDGIPKGTPSLMVALKYQAKAATVGFDWSDVSGVEDKVREELAEIFAETDSHLKAREITDLMFVLVNWLRWLGIDDPESLMREQNAKFYRRFHYIESQATNPPYGNVA